MRHKCLPPTDLISKSLRDAIAAELSAPVLTITFGRHVQSKGREMPPSTLRQKSLRGPIFLSSVLYTSHFSEMPTHSSAERRAGGCRARVGLSSCPTCLPFGRVQPRGRFFRRRGMMLGPTSDTRERRRKLHRCPSLRPWDRMNGRAGGSRLCEAENCGCGKLEQF